jgi:hypothetical protein
MCGYDDGGDFVCMVNIRGNMVFGEGHVICYRTYERVRDLA